MTISRTLSYDAHLARLKNAINSYISNKSSLIAAYNRGNISEPEYNKRMHSIDSRIDELKNRLEKLEDVLSGNVDDMLEEYAKKIATDCMPVIRESRYMVIDDPYYGLWRGIMDKDLPVLTLSSRLSQRSPRDTPPTVHNEVNKFFINNYGRPWRNAVFATSSVQIASEYSSQVYKIFPVGDFEFLWSTNSTDMTDTLEKLDNPETAEEIESLFREYNVDFLDYDLEAAIKSDNEIMIWADKYYAVNYDYIETFHEFLMRELIKREATGKK